MVKIFITNPSFDQSSNCNYILCFIDSTDNLHFIWIVRTFVYVRTYWKRKMNIAVTKPTHDFIGWFFHTRIWHIWWLVRSVCL